MPGDDETARSVGARGSRLDALPPGIGDFRGLVERLPLIIYIDEPDPKSPSLYISPETTLMLGYTPEDWASSPDFFVSICHPDDLERVLAETSRLLAEGGQTPIEFRVMRRDGSVAWVRDEAVVVRDEAGEPLCTQGYMLDITERKEREAAVRQADARTRAMLDAALDGVVMIDHRGAIIEFNPAAERIFGYEREAVVGRQMVDLIVPPAYRAAHSAGFQRYLATGESTVLGRRIEIRAMRADGSEFPLELSIAAVDVGGEPVFTAYVRDISDQHRREAALLESEAIVNSSFDAVDRTHDRRHRHEMEPRCRARVRLHRGGDHRTLRLPRCRRPNSTASSRSLNARLRAGEVVEPFEAVRVRKDGQRIHAESTLAPIVSASGEIIGISSIARDITERKRSQALAAEQAELLGVHRDGRRPATRPRSTGAVRREARRRRLASILLAGSRRAAPAPRRGSEPPAVLLRGDRRACDRPEGRVLRDGGVPARARLRLGHRDRPAVERLPRACARRGARRVLVDADLRDGRRVARHVRPLLPRAPRLRGGDVDLVELATHLAGIAIERARSEEAARESEERYRDLFENANEPIGTVTMDEQITEVNRAFERVLGYSRAELIGTSLSRVPDPGRGARPRARRPRASCPARSRARRSSRSSSREGRAHRDPRGLEPRDRGGRAPGRRSRGSAATSPPASRPRASCAGSPSSTGTCRCTTA